MLLERRWKLWRQGTCGTTKYVDAANFKIVINSNTTLTTQKLAEMFYYPYSIIADTKYTNKKHNGLTSYKRQNRKPEIYSKEVLCV